MAVTFCTAAQTPADNPNRLVLHTVAGETHVFNLGEMDYFDFDKVGSYSVALSLKEGSLAEDAFTVVATPSAECASFTIALSAAGSAIGEAQQFTAEAEIPFADLRAGVEYTVTATPADIYGIEGEASSITVTTVAAQMPPKVGDYYYSDGTWSDGGLISIDADGQNAVWAASKPAPLAGKTVVGIIFNTNPARMADSDKADGFTHGYVIGCKNVTDPGKSNYAKYPESVWYSNQDELSVKVQTAKTSKTWYNSLTGRNDTKVMLEKFPGDEAKTNAPLFYYSTEGYPVAAPEGTSGWFVPSTGQMWTCIANFCSGKVAKFLSEYQNDTYDMTYNSEKTKEPVLDNFMRVFELVPAADKDEITINDADYAPTSVALRCSNRYDTESACHFNLGTDSNGVIEGMAGWFNEEGHARPILAF